MDARHELSVDPSRLLSGFDAPQRPQPYGDLCRPPGSDASTLSYHSRYLASMPVGSTFPFLGGMFTGTLPGPPTSPFRAPSTPGMNNMRFWPPTPPPEGYGRYSMNTSLFPLFGAPSPDSGAFLSQGLVSRLGSTTHLSPVIDHKEHSFFTHGIGLGSPLTPTSHVTSPSPFPHLIPSLDRHPAYIGHMTLSSKDMEDLQHESDDVRLMKSHMDCIMKHNIPSSRQDRLKSKSESKLCCEKGPDDCCKLLSPPCIPRDKSHENHRHGSKLEGKHHHSSRHQPTNKVHPCKIEVSHSPALKPDLLSPPIDSPRPDTSSPCKKKSVVSPVPLVSSPSAVTNHVNNNETRCSQCCATMKGVGLATKISNGVKEGALVSRTTDSHVSKNCPVVTTMSMTNSDFMSSTVSVNHSHATTEHVESKQNNQKSPRTSPVILPDGGEKLQDQSPFKPKNVSETAPHKSANGSSVALKHVTAAVIPTAPKQIVHREIHPELNCSAAQETSKETSSCEPRVSEVSSFAPINQDVKTELNDTSVHSERAAFTVAAQSSSSSTIFTSNSPTVLNKPLAGGCKVKDMVHNSSAAKQMNGDKQQLISPFRNSEMDLSKTMPNSPVKSVPSTTSVSPTIMTKSPCLNAKVLPTTHKSPSPIMKAEVVSARMDCEFSQRSTTSWSKATVMPYNWQNNGNQDDQAINLTVTKKPVKPEPSEALSLIVKEDSTHQSSIKFGSEGAFPNNGMIGVCHPNPSPVAVNKVKGTPAVSSISNFSSISVVNQPTEQSTEVHILHRSSKSSFPIVNRNTTPPVPLKSTISHVTANTSIRSVKAERLTTKRGKLGEVDKLGHSGRATLATLAPKISKTVGFGKDSQTSHTLSASSSVSSTSIVFPATVNPCIPVGIAIAQQRQDSSSTTTGKSQSSVPSSTPSSMTPNQNLAASRVAVDLQAQELLADQKNQDLPCSNNPTPVDTNLLVTQGPTIVSRQWESEALTRTAMPSASWLTHGSVVAPAVWLGQGAYAAAAPPSNPVPSIAMNPLEPSPISLPPGGYQLARDSISGHLLLIPTANIELMDRPSVWPTFNAPTGNLPIQQLVTQQQHTQFEQVLPHTETIKTDGIETCNITSCDISAQTKTEEKVEEISGQVPSVPLATGQTYAFTTFPTQCDPSTFSYVLQSSTVMHLAHTQTAASIQTESGRRSQGTSPLHCATPSPPPNSCSVQASVTEDEEESDDNESDGVACGEATEVRSCLSQSVTTAIQVDMDSQTNSEEDEEEEHKSVTDEKMAVTKVEMSDSANQTESVHSESPKSEPEPEPIEIDLKVPEAVEEQPLSPEPPKPLETETETIISISIKEDIISSEPGMEIVTSETELAPSLPVESKPVMDFIDHHGLNLLVDSIEEFASRGQEEAESVTDVTLPSSDSIESKATTDDELKTSEPPTEEVAKEEEPLVDVLDEKSYPSKYKNIDTSCTDSLGLLCALAEQRIFEEALNDESKTKAEEKQESVKAEDSKNPKEDSVVKDQANSNDSFLSSSSSQDYEEASQLDMRVRLAELQKKYRQKQRELELLRNKRERESSDDELESTPNSPQTTKTPLSKDSLSLSKPLKEGKHSKSSTPRPWKKQKKNPDKDINDNTRVKSSGFKKSKHISNKTEMKNGLSEEEHAKVPSITLVHETNIAISGDSSNSGSSFSRGAYSKKESKVENYGSENSLESGSCISKDEGSSQDQNYDKNDKSKVPVFDEQAWFVRRSERIFLSDARSVPTTASDKSSKKSSSSSQKGCTDVSQKEKKEHVKPVKVTKITEESDNKKVKNKSLNKPRTYLSKKIVESDSNDSESSSDDSSDSENSDGASSTSDNLPLSTFVEHANSKATPERPKRLSVDSVCSDISSGQSEDIPLSVLIGQKEENLPELKSCILKPAELQENARLLVLDEGLFYAGHITKSDDPETFGILIDGDRAARPHMFTREEILNAAVLEVKPTHQQQLPEGTRICAFWSQQYRCLYPGTVTKASSPMPDPSMLHVEFDDGDSGRIPLSDIRMLPPDFPIVSMEPNPFMILGKRRSRAQSQNSCGTNDGKTGNDPLTQKQEKDKSELKKHKSSEKSSKKSHSEKKCKDGVKRKRSPSASNLSRSSSKSSSSDHPDQSIAKKDTSSEDLQEPKSSEPITTPKDSSSSDLKVSLTCEPKPKKHKKHKDDHHKHHHHHHHKHHHHKKHKLDKHDRSAVTPSPRRSEPQDTFVLENSKSELTFTIKKSPSPHTNLEEAASAADKKMAAEASGSSSSEEDEEPQKKKVKKTKQDSSKPAKRKERVPSVEKSKIAAFLPMRQLWRWSGKSYRRPGAKGKAKKEFFRAIQRGKESIKVGDCAVFLSTGRPHLPYIGRIETMWESWGGKMDVKVKWFYHPEETKSGKKLSQLKGALFQSPHFDENDVQTISHKCEVLSWDEYQQKKHHGSLLDNNDTYFLAGTYDPILGTLILEPGVPNVPSNNNTQDQ